MSQPSGNGSLLPPCVLLNDSIPGITPLDWLVTGDGFQQQYQEYFAQKKAREIYDYIRSQSPWKNRRISWRVFFLPACSTDQGISHSPQYPEWPIRKTMYGVDQINDSYDVSFITKRMTAAEVALGISGSKRILFTNTSGSSANAGAVLYAPIGNEVLSGARVFLHEYGHTHGLADEYFLGGAAPSHEPDAPNVTLNTDRASLKWLRLVNTPVSPWPTDNSDPALLDSISIWPPITPSSDPFPPTGVGLYRGGFYSSSVYRPSHNCRMRGADFPFCDVCSNHLEGEYAPYIAGDVAPHEYRPYGIDSLGGTTNKRWLGFDVLANAFAVPVTTSLLGAKTIQRAATIDYLTIALSAAISGTALDCYIEINGVQQNTSQVHIASNGIFGTISNLGLGVAVGDKVSVSVTASTTSTASVYLRGRVGVH